MTDKTVEELRQEAAALIEKADSLDQAAGITKTEFSSKDADADQEEAIAENEGRASQDDVILTRADLTHDARHTPNAKVKIDHFSLSHQSHSAAHRILFVDGDFTAVLKDRNGTMECAVTAQVPDVLVPAVSQSEFDEKITPKKLDHDPDPAKRVNLFKCPSCKGVHMRHAGYMEAVLPYVLAGDGAKVSRDSLHVMICVKCKNAYVWHNGQMYDVTDQVDLTAWETTEEECHAAVGPGGDC